MTLWEILAGWRPGAEVAFRLPERPGTYRIAASGRLRQQNRRGRDTRLFLDVGDFARDDWQGLAPVRARPPAGAAGDFSGTDDPAGTAVAEEERRARGETDA